MAGLFDKTQMAQGVEQANQEMGQEESNVSQEEQAQYDEFVTNAMAFMYDEKNMGNLVTSMEKAPNPIEGVASAAFLVVSSLEQSAKKNGKEFSGDVKMNAGAEIIEQLVELAEAKGIHEFSEDDIESAYFAALDKYGEAKSQSGELDQQAAQQDLQELQAADQQGRIEEIAPGVTEYAQRKAQQQQQ